MIYISVSLVVLFPLIVLILFISWKTNSKKQENNNHFTAIKEDNRACALTESKENRCKIIEDSFTAEHLPHDNALVELQICIKNLSAALHELYELMNADMSQVSAFFEDPKYEEFVWGYKLKIWKCEEISIRYSDWCTKVLAPAIDELFIEIEKADVTGNGGSGGGGAITCDGGGGATGGDSNRPLSAAEKAARFKKANEFLKNKIAESTPGPQGSGVATPQNERPYLSPLQMKILRDGKEN